MARGHDNTAQPDGGRHRRGMRPSAWTPRARRARGAAAHARDAEADTDVIPLVPDHYPDLPATGLAKFDLGTIPASVTPPRSWRRAAWFAVGASSLVLVGLVFAAATLVTGPRKPDIVDALPGLPTAPNMLTGGPEDITATTPSPRPTSASPSSTTPQATPTPSRTPRPVPSPPAASAPPEATAQPPVATPSPPRPTRTTVSTPALVPPGTDTQAMGDRTEAYYRQVTEDPDAAYAMTTGQLYREGPDSIERRYAGVERVEVRSIIVDANRATTRSQLRVVREDGTVTTMERELTFTYGQNPKISEDSAAS